jgi:regulator of cell morphogenesis and NO signaling
MIPEEHTLADIVRKFPAAAAVFEKYDLDYCCHGDVTLRTACPDEALFHKVEHALHRIMENAWTDSDTLHYDHLRLPELVHHILGKHHAYAKAAIPRISASLDKLALRHGEKHPEVLEIRERFRRLATEMDLHMLKEEQVLFPLIREIAKLYEGDDGPWTLSQLDVSAPIGVMHQDHDSAGTLLHEIKELSQGYTLPEDACATYRACFDELKQFEQDLHHHVHLENNILFPKALDMQHKLLQGSFN